MIFHRLITEEGLNFTKGNTTYKITQTDYGIRLLFSGRVSHTETTAWLTEFKGYVAQQESSYGVFVDMRTMEPLDMQAQKDFEDGQRLARENGMNRSAVILDNSTLTYQFKRIALQSGIYDWERYIDASEATDWEEIGVIWLTAGIDPDATRRERISKRREQVL